MKVLVIIFSLQCLHYSLCHEDTAVANVDTTEDQNVSKAETYTATTTVETETTKASVESKVNLDIAGILAAIPFDCCSRCPPSMKCENDPHKWGCSCEMTEEQKARRERIAQAVRERLGITKAAQHTHPHGADHAHD